MSGGDLRILMADDDPDDRLLIQEAMDEAGLNSQMDFAVDGEDLLDRLHKRGDYTDTTEPLPDLLLLDLNMPRKDGRECLEEIRAEASLCHLPVVVLTTSSAQEDVMRCYRLGANSFVSKPVNFDGMVELVRNLLAYWSQSSVRLPVS